MNTKWLQCTIQLCRQVTKNIFHSNQLKTTDSKSGSHVTDEVMWRQQENFK